MSCFSGFRCALGALSAVLLCSCSTAPPSLEERIAYQESLRTAATGTRNPQKPPPPEAEPSPVDNGRVIRTSRGVEVLSPLYRVDRIYKSMKGPWNRQLVKFLESPMPELVWVTGCRVEMVSADGQTRMDDQLMCHANLDMDTSAHQSLFADERPLDGRVFTLSQGQLAVAFPEGFGIPFRSDESIDLVTQVLNLNIPNPDLSVRHRVLIDFIRDRDCLQPMKPLFECGIYGMKALEGTKLCFDQLLSEHGGALCLPGKTANSEDLTLDAYGRRFTGHWIVKPGREVNRTRVTTRLNLKGDATVHYIAVHLHPFAESIELRDTTADRTVFKSKAVNVGKGIGLNRVDSLASAEGIKLFQGHEYELVSAYHNTSNEEQDSMAVLYLYVHDATFRRPEIVPSVGMLSR